MTEDTAGYAQRQEQGLEKRTEPSTLPYRTLGDLELFSVNRIRDRLARLEIDSDARWRITECLAEENRKQRRSDHHHKTSCTFYTLDHCVEKLRDYLNEQVCLALESQPQLIPELGVLQLNLSEGVITNLNLIKNCLSDNYRLTLYDTRGVIPATLVREMKRKVKEWAEGKREVLAEPLEPLVRRIADEFGLYTNGYSPRKIWDELMKVA